MRDKMIGKLRSIQPALLLFLIMHGSLFGVTVNLLLKVAEEDCWIAMIVGAILGFIPFYIFISLSTSYPDLNIFEIIEKICGKYLGKFINIIIFLFVIFYISGFFWNLTNLISSQYLYKTPQFFIYMIFAVAIIYIIHSGMEAMFRSIIIVAIMAFILHMISFFGLVSQVNVQNTMPILKNGFSPVIEAAMGYISFCITPIILLSVFPNNHYEDKDKYKKLMSISYIVSSISVFSIIFFIIGVFGIDLAQLYQYPDFQILRRVTIGDFIERIENTLSIHWIYELFSLVTIGIYFLKTEIHYFFNVKSKTIKYVLNISLLTIFIVGSYYMFQNNTIESNFSTKRYPFVAYLFLAIFLIISIIGIIKKKSKKNKSIASN